MMLDDKLDLTLSEREDTKKELQGITCRPTTERRASRPRGPAYDGTTGFKATRAGPRRNDRP